MGVPRIIILSLLSFFAPVVLAVFLAPVFFPEKPNAAQYERARLQNTPDEAVVAKRSSEPPAELAPASFKEIAAAKRIDPQDEQAFIVSARIRFSRVPEIGQRERLLFKYAVAEQPYSGWALALRRWPGSIRPEVYWRDRQGKGGWFPFKNLEVRTGIWYTFTFVAEGRALSLYVSDESGRGFPESFAGGFPLDEVSLPQSSDSLFLAPLVDEVSQRHHPVEATELLIAQVGSKRLKRLLRAASNDVSSLRERLEQDEVTLSLTPENGASVLSS